MAAEAPQSVRKYKNYSHVSLEAIKKNPGVWPVLFCIAAGLSMATAYTLRLALYNPDVTWRPTKRLEPWQAYENRDYKFMKMEPFDTKNYIHPRPRI